MIRISTSACTITSVVVAAIIGVSVGETAADVGSGEGVCIGSNVGDAVRVGKGDGVGVGSGVWDGVKVTVGDGLAVGVGVLDGVEAHVGVSVAAGLTSGGWVVGV